MKFPKCGLWFNYPLSKCVSLMGHAGWYLNCHVLVLGPLGFTVLWRVKKPADKGTGG